MRVLILNGSTRTNGNTYKLGIYLKEFLAEKGHEFIEVNDYVSDCLNCGNCHDTHICCVRDEMRIDFNRVDAVIVLSPMFFFNISGKAKLMVDRLYPNNNKDLMITSITVSGSEDFSDSGVDQFWNNLESTCNYCGYHLIDPINYVSYDEIIEFDEGDLSLIYELIENMEELYREIKKEN